MATFLTPQSNLDRLKAAGGGASLALYKFGVDVAAVEATDQPRRMRFTISTGGVDRDNDTIDPAGWDLAAFKRNPVVLWAHDMRSLPVGKAVAVGVENGKLTAEVEFATHEFAETVYQLYRGGFMRATSVGFRPLKYALNEERRGVDFQEQELLEFSMVPVPANAEALVGASAVGVGLEPLRKWLGDTIAAWPGELRLTGKAWDKMRPAMAEQVVDLTVARELVALREKIDALASVGSVAKVAREVLFSPALLKAETLALLAPAPAPAETLRWNPKAKAAFDVARVQFEAETAEYALVGKYLDVELKHIERRTAQVMSARVGAHLSAIEDVVAAWRQDDVRNLTHDGKECPLEYDVVQLNSTLRRDFLVGGIRFLSASDNSVRAALRVEPRWYGLQVTTYGARSRGTARQLMGEVGARASEINYLKGEAFSLSGQFLPKTAETGADLFLSADNAKAIKRVTDLVNTRGAALENRGLILCGPPGTGKTLAGRILRNGCAATFVWVSSRDFHYAGAFGGIADAFDIARECVPTVLFIEDVDNWLSERTVDLLKTEMDGIARSTGLVTILTTNFPEQLPAALIDRPGRFHDVLRFDLPDDAARDGMLRRWLPDLGDAERAAAVAATAGYSGAHVRELARFAGIIRDQDGLEVGPAVEAALGKLREQRDLITAVQTQGSRYRAPEGLAVTKTAAPVAPAAKDEPALDVEDAPAPVALAPDELLDVEDAPEDVLAGLDPADVRAAVTAVVRENLRDMARGAAVQAINKVRGRLD
jgi:HK97 family phage prohead protease